jgi:hypothetical protein
VDRGVVAIHPHHHRDDATSVARPHKRPMPGIAGVGFNPPGASWIIDRPIPAASWIINRPHPAASRIDPRTHPAAS